MATIRNQLSYGSQGSDVTELQKLLNQRGYNLSEDGIFGDNTQKAVKEYQQKSGLDVDGIVGTNTWGSLNGTYTSNKNTSAATKPADTASASTGFKYDAYQESDLVKQAQAMLQQQMANKPGEYTSPWQSQLNDTINKIMNREKFSYDLNGDALYQQYKDQYINQGKMAMMDTMGQAAALTGGYGNSYAQSVGQQAYQGHLQQLNDKIPELYQLAMSKYQMEGDDLYNQYAMLGAQDQQDYGRYRDTVSDYNTELDRLINQYNSERDLDYGKWADNRDFGFNQFVDDRNYQYQTGRDQVADSQWQAEFNEAVRQFNFLNKLGEFAPTPVVSSGGSGGRYVGSGSGGLYDTHGLTKEEIIEMQKAAGITPDGIWGPDTQKAYEAGYGDTGSDDAPDVPDVPDVQTNVKVADVGTRTGQQQLTSQINKEINKAYQSGQITAAQAAQLKKETNPKGYTK